ncbi:MAG TPA: hypothetical protein VK849_11145 [Longimicrobiales bacterium]|nr:hypothetical protein [Longimicrobiales bacterium]
MSLLALATWTAVCVLVPGSLAVFVWFLADAEKVLHGPVGESGGEPAAGGSAGPGSSES